MTLRNTKVTVVLEFCNEAIGLQKYFPVCQIIHITVICTELEPFLLFCFNLSQFLLQRSNGFAKFFR